MVIHNDIHQGEIKLDTQDIQLFQLTNTTVENMRYIKLDKKASYTEKVLEDIAYNDIQYESVLFYSFGFYDSLECIKLDGLSSLTHKESFLISYPFKKSANTLKVEQWFSILPVSNKHFYSGGKGIGEGGDPFFCKKSLCAKLPFAGVILISLSRPLTKTVQGGQGNSDFKKSLEEAVFLINEYFQKADSSRNYMARIYYTLNCADLCLVIRTDELSFIYDTSSRLDIQASWKGYCFNTTVIYSVQNNTGTDCLELIADKNDNVSFVVRSNRKYISDDCDSKMISHGVSGVGKYVTTFEYGRYIKFLPKIFSYKLGRSSSVSETNDDLYAESICHEREWFQDRYPQDGMDLNEQKQIIYQALHSWIRDIYNKIQEIERDADRFFTYAGGTHIYREMFEREFRLIKDLVFTYSDLWYQTAPEGGFAFFIQLWVMLDGLQKYIDKINESGNCDEVLWRSVENMLVTMHSVICDLNGFNKQYQHLNQDSVNYPSYEIQSKVNAEKYMSAYCSFMHRFFALYYTEKKDTEYIVQSFPMAFVDISKRTVVANIFFHYLYASNTKKTNVGKRSIFAVHFPSSEYFSDVWIIIPLLMHEMSHTHHYGNTEDRNSAIIHNINYFFADILMSKMLLTINDGIRINTSDYLGDEFTNVAYHAINSCFIKYCEDSSSHKENYHVLLKNWRLSELLQKCKEFYHGMFNGCDSAKNISYNQISIFKKKIKENIDDIMQKVGFDKMCYAAAGRLDVLPVISYFANVLYLQFDSEFLQNYRETYKNFESELTAKLYNCPDEIEKIILLLSLYRYKKYINNEDAKAFKNPEFQKLEIDMTGYLYLALTVLLRTAMRAVFEKHRTLFKEMSEEFLYERLVPDIYKTAISEFAVILTDAYHEFTEEIRPNDHLNENIVKTMFSEYYEIYLCILNIANALMNKQLMADSKAEISEEFADCLHAECKKYVENIEKAEHSLQLMFTRSNREQLVKLGFLEEKSSITKSVFHKVLAETRSKTGMDDSESAFTDIVIQERKFLFQEVYADCGMCCAIGFDPFGYCMFTMSVHNMVGELNAIRKSSSFLADRIRSVIRMFFSEDEKEQWPEMVEKFFHKLFDTGMVQSICEMLLAEKPSAEVQKIMTYSSNKEFEVCWKDSGELFENVAAWTLIQWQKDIVGALARVIEMDYCKAGSRKFQDKLDVAKSYLFKIKSLLDLFIKEKLPDLVRYDAFKGFFQQLKKQMLKGKAIQHVKNDPYVNTIRQFYNIDDPAVSQGSSKFEWYYHMHVEGFIHQCNFIFKNYCEYRNAYNRIIQEIRLDKKPQINEWFDILDHYYTEEARKAGSSN